MMNDDEEEEEEEEEEKDKKEKEDNSRRSIVCCEYPPCRDPAHLKREYLFSLPELVMRGINLDIRAQALKLNASLESIYSSCSTFMR